jgi:hypothetical protein
VKIDPVAVLVDTCLTYIRTHFYQDKPTRDYHRDEPALMKAIARYGYLCHQRHWEFEPLEIQKDLIALLRNLLGRMDEIKYLPIYLEKAIDRHIGLRAEELSAKAKAKKQVSAIVSKEMDGKQVVVIKEATTTEKLSTLYADLALRKAERRAERKAAQAAKKAETKELTLL